MAPLLPIILLSLAATHAVAAPPSLGELFAKPDISDIKISPEGDKLAVRRLVEGERYALQFLSLPGLSPTAMVDIDLPRGQNEVGDFWWANNNRVVGIVMQYEKGSTFPVTYGELFGANSDGSDATLLFGARVGNVIAQTLGNYQHRLPHDPNQILVRTQKWTPRMNATPKVRMLDIYSKKRGPVLARGLSPMTRFLADASGEVRLMMTNSQLEEFRVAFRPDDEWIDVPDTVVGSNFRPASLTSEDQSFYSLDRFASDRLSLYRFSITEMQQELLYQHDTVDVTGVVTSSDGRDVVALRFFDGYPSYEILDDAGEDGKVLADLLAQFPGMNVEITSRSDDGSLWTVVTHTDRDVGTYYLFDRDTGRTTRLFDQDKVNGERLSEARPITYESVDGLSIHGYFTPAVSDAPGVSPLVVLVHGGPRLRDFWVYNPEVQAYATNGISVLQVNYRGSTGYGADFMSAGNGEWGDKVQRDIIAGVNWAIDEGLADRQRVCIAGTSFGAYSAVMSATIEPGLFQCVIANGGIYDLELLYRRGDIQDYFFGESYLAEVVGTDRAILRAFSPTAQVHKLSAPVLVAHGKKDVRAPFVHARRLVTALRKSGKRYDTMFESDEGHGFYDSENQVELMQRAIDFVHRHTAKPAS